MTRDVHSPLSTLFAQPIAVAPQTTLETAGPAAARIGDLWNLMLWLGTAITIVVLAALAWAIFHRRPEGAVAEADRPADMRGERLNDESGGRGSEERGRPRSERIGVRVMVGAGIVFPAVVLGVLLVFVLRVSAAVSLPSHSVRDFGAPPEDEMVIEVTGRQFWWRVEYMYPDPQLAFETANEIHIPVGRPVTLRLASDDVIHSLWVPALQGKMDLIPGRTNALRIEASQPGTWRGQCAEFCGVQHAKMALVVVAHPPEEYARWEAAQRAPAPEPHDSAASADRDVFLASGCVLCHSVRGTLARGGAGPDLTHVSSRLTLAAGTLPNAPGHLYGWVANPQAIKPGSLMPAVRISPEDLHAIVRYLRTLH